MAIIILPLYIYLIIRRSNIQIKTATNIKYTLLDFKKIQPGVKLKGWQEISNGTKSYISIKDGEIDKKHIAKVYRPSISESDTSSKTASMASLHTMKSSHSSRSVKSVSMSPIVSGSNTDDSSKPTINSITGSESTKNFKQHTDPNIV
ncbi:Uncharacterized protein BM_BM1385 [Brugia malayi]|nr:Uncharacterized protein BM_BM1385 [Brugia malayi]VIO92882.1 Uncharacterized protein BM_BM1385 [Brugia malayi]